MRLLCFLLHLSLTSLLCSNYARNNAPRLINATTGSSFDSLPHATELPQRERLPQLHLLQPLEHQAWKTASFLTWMVLERADYTCFRKAQCIGSMAIDASLALALRLRLEIFSRPEL